MDDKFTEYLDQTISKNSNLNRVFFGITLLSLIIGVYALYSRQNDLLTTSKSLAKNNDSLNSKVAELYAANVKLNDSAKIYADLLMLKKDKDDLALSEEKTKPIDDNTSTTASTSTDILPKRTDRQISAASTLIASNMSVIPMQDKMSGKDKETSTAKKVNKLIFRFDIQNKVSSTGQTDVFVRIIGPDGKLISVPSLGSGSFTTREEGDVGYTVRISVDIDGGRKKTVQFAWKQNSEFQKGKYKIILYHQGYKIGQDTLVLKKSGLFG